MSHGMWGGWKFLAAENINGDNSIIWKYSDNYGDSFWLSIHDDQGNFINSDDPGYPGYIDPNNPSYNDSPDARFYTTETNFNLDLNSDGQIGAPPNKAPVLNGAQYTFPTLEVGQEFTIWEYDLLEGVTDPDGDDIYIDDTWTDYGSLTFNYDSLTAYLPVGNNQELELDMILESRPGSEQYLAGLSFTVPEYLSDTALNIYYEIIDGNGGGLEVSQSLSIAPVPVSYTHLTLPTKA